MISSRACPRSHISFADGLPHRLSLNSRLPTQSHSLPTKMRSLLVVAALLSNAVTTLAAAHAHADAHVHSHAHHKIAKHRRQRRHEEEQLPEEEKLKKRELHARNTDAADQMMATNWIEPGYEGDFYQDECTRHHNYHRENHAVSLPFSISTS